MMLQSRSMPGPWSPEVGCQCRANAVCTFSEQCCISQLRLSQFYSIHGKVTCPCIAEHCKKGCQGPLLRPLRRFGMLGSRFSGPCGEVVHGKGIKRVKQPRLQNAHVQSKCQLSVIIWLCGLAQACTVSSSSSSMPVLALGES